MAGTTSIEDILSSVVDETAVSALIGSLESKLAAGNSSAAASPLDGGSNHVSQGATGSVEAESSRGASSTVTAAVRDDGAGGASTEAGPVAAASVAPTAAPTAALASQVATEATRDGPSPAPTPQALAEPLTVGSERSTASPADKKDANSAAVVVAPSPAAASLSATPGPAANISTSPTPATCVRIVTLPPGKPASIPTVPSASQTNSSSSTTNTNLASNVKSVAAAAKNVVPNATARTVVKAVVSATPQQQIAAAAAGAALTTVTSSALSTGSSPSARILSGQPQVLKQLPVANVVGAAAGATPVAASSVQLVSGGKPNTTAIVASGAIPTAVNANANTSAAQPQIVLRPAPSLHVVANKAGASSTAVITPGTATTATTIAVAAVTAGATQAKLATATPVQQQSQQQQHAVGLQQVRLASPQVIAPRAAPGGTAVQFRLPQGTSLPPGVMLINKDGNIHAVVNSSIGPGGQIQHLPTGAVPGTVTYRQVQRPVTQPTSVVQTTIRPNMAPILNTTNATIGQLKGGAQVVVGGSPVTFLSKAGVAGSPTITASGQGLQAAAPKVVGVSSGVASGVASPGAIQRPGGGTPPAASNLQPILMSHSAMENVKKCRNFLTTLIKLASNGNQPAETVKNVKELVQNLIDGRTEPEEFTLNLQKELKSSPQPYLIPFLKKSLPLLRQTLQKGGSLQIQGLSAPPVTAAQATDSLGGVASATASASVAASQPTLVSTLAAGPGGKTTTLSLTAQQLQQLQQQHQAAKGKQQNVKVMQLPTFAQKAKAQPAVTSATPASSKTSSSSHSSSSSRSSQSKSHSSKSSSSKSSSSSSSSSSSKKDKVKDHSSSSGFKDDDDINDVTSMAGVNLSEESARILATNADFIGTQVRSIKEEKFLVSGPLQTKVNQICLKHGIQEASPEMMDLVSHAAQERLKGLVEKLGVIAMHRMEVYRNDSRYEVTSDVRTQLKFFEQLDSLERKRRDEQEREILLRAAKSRSKQEDPEQARLKQKAKEMQQMELEQIRQQEANMTALAAIGPRKKRKLDSPTPGSAAGSGSSALSIGGTVGSSTVRSKIRRIKRVNFRDLIFLMEQEQEMKKSQFFFKMFFK